MRNRELTKTVVLPEASVEGISDDAVQLPGSSKGSGEDLLVGGDGVPNSADAAGSSQVRNRQLLEDEPEDVAAGEGREV